ncbi:hypothetical protein [Paracoccus methylarcula]|uniref:hypothetical protein n=1 Tax=Paracoccus methylarcula TaxID=72022 RepID=UPI0011CD396C|nr:hypothetical protein [Paracoccus methylarcula]
MSNTDNTIIHGSSTLTEQQLFNRFLDAPIRTGTRSTLVDSLVSHENAEWHFFGFAGCESCCLDAEMPERIIEELRECDDPAYEIGVAIGDLEGFLEALRVLKEEFASVAEATRVPEPEETGDEEIDDQAYNDWVENPRFILPATPDRREAA